MPGDNFEEVLRCPCCGMVSTVPWFKQREDPFPFEETIRTFGGKRKLTEQERIDRVYEGELRKEGGRGSAPGTMSYEDWGPASPELKELMLRRIADVQQELGEG